jgi:hypothetical protein
MDGALQVLRLLDEAGGRFVFGEAGADQAQRDEHQLRGDMPVSGWWGRELNPNHAGELVRGVLLWFLVTLSTVAMVDQLLVRWIFHRQDARASSPTARRWFLLHFFFNAYVVAHTLSHVGDALFRPYATYMLSEPYTFVSQFSTTAIAAFHLYHALFFPLSAEDIWHHLIK